MTFSRYLSYRLKRVALRTSLLAFLPLPFLLMDLAARHPSQNLSPSPELTPLKTVLAVLATILPMVEMAPLKKRRNLDVLYSFPINRWQLGVAHYLCGLIQLVTVYSAMFFTQYFFFLKNTDYFDMKLLLAYYGISLLMGWIIYSYVLFFFSEANTVADGILFFLVSSVMGIVFLWFLGTVWKPASGGHIPAWGFLYTPLSKLTNSFTSLVKLNLSYPYEYDQKELLYTVPWLILGLCTTVAYFFNMAHKPFEKTESLSNGQFGYQFLIPFCGFPLCILFGVGAIFPISLMFAGYVILRRRIKLKKIDYWMLGIGTGLGLAGGLYALTYL